MGLEISGTQRVDPEDSNNHTTQRRVSLEGRDVLAYMVKKQKHKQPPLGFKMDWMTTQDNLVLAAAAADFYVGLRNQYQLPDDPKAQAITKEIRSRCMSITALRVWDGSLSEAVLDQMRAHRERIEPFQMTLYTDPKDLGRPMFFFRNNPNEEIDVLKDRLLQRFPPIDLMRVTVEFPYGRLQFGGDEGFRRDISFSSPYRLVGKPLELFRTTSAAAIDNSQFSQLIGTVGNHTRALPKLPRAS